MKKTMIKATLPTILALALTGGAGTALAGTVGITGQYDGMHSFTLYNGATGTVLGTSTTNPSNAWSFDFDAGTFTLAGGMTSLSFPYSFSGAMSLVDNTDGTYTGTYDIAIGTYGPATTTIKWDISLVGGAITVTTLDTDSNGIPGTTLAGVMPLPISPVMDGTATVVPIPAAMWLFGSGLLGLAGVARRRKAS